MHASKARSRILGTLTGKWQRDAPFFTQSGLHTDAIFGQVRDTTVQVWTVGEGLGIGSEFSQTCCAANNFRDHEVLLKEQATKLAALYCGKRADVPRAHRQC